ncbi:acyl-protein thioesterase 1 [Cordyceps fumosorosea ARSEF 2679]|uniref:Acyl-protein thioesterase 1 n=1 Tax=Cordyceps fumosorosea (strain ARSEF 2679) TaxID=1081104 RepID=A0A167N4W2_CORFA|nr:acyl-protein thioesterase 1 [Cordyceps fumosorosea ARSEF 2679]OAA55129.1 acyl-protein thioesterase 1 [Cordyceps fumosorosea ARSEF 2679]
MAEPRPDPIYIEPKVAPPSSEQASAVIFIHGLSDRGESFRGKPNPPLSPFTTKLLLVEHYQSADKLPHTLWVLPTADYFGDPPVRAWYRRPTLVPERALEPATDDDYEGIMASCAYILAIVRHLESARGIPASRVAVGGFSQGCALSLVLGLASSYAGRFAGIFGLMGYLPLRARLDAIRGEQGGRAVVDQPVMVARGRSDEFLAKWYHEACWKTLGGMGIRKMDVHEYDVGHTVLGMEVRRDLCSFLEERCGF